MTHIARIFGRARAIVYLRMQIIVTICEYTLLKKSTLLCKTTSKRINTLKISVLIRIVIEIINKMENGRLDQSKKVGRCCRLIGDQLDAEYSRRGQLAIIVVPPLHFIGRIYIAAIQIIIFLHRYANPH